MVSASRARAHALPCRQIRRPRKVETVCAEAAGVLCRRAQTGKTGQQTRPAHTSTGAHGTAVSGRASTPHGLSRRLTPTHSSTRKAALSALVASPAPRPRPLCPSGSQTPAAAEPCLLPGMPGCFRSRQPRWRAAVACMPAARKSPGARHGWCWAAADALPVTGGRADGDKRHGSAHTLVPAARPPIVAVGVASPRSWQELPRVCGREEVLDFFGILHNTARPPRAFRCSLGHPIRLEVRRHSQRPS